MASPSCKVWVWRRGVFQSGAPRGTPKPGGRFGVLGDPDRLGRIQTPRNSLPGVGCGCIRLRLVLLGLFACLVLALAGCATPQINRPANPRPFDFQRDTFAFAN